MTEQDLWIASRRYMRGEISIEELKAVEKPYNDAYMQALFVLEKRYFWRRMHASIRKKSHRAERRRE